ncbi:MAG TPA: penicillin acylase family protein, partial [Polyangiaceae bacterium]|nr:penicillin acylase family protein [Polyangiaceae bacterium]
MSRRSSHTPILSPSLLAILLACACDTDSVHDEREKIELRYTEYGIPQLRAASYENLGYAQGYAQARDNLCEMARSQLAFNGQLSRYFGPDAPGTRMSSAPNSLASDLYFTAINDSGIVEDLVSQSAPLGPREEVRQLVRGFSDGFNAFLAGPDASGNGAPSCSNAEWLRPMTELDVYRRAYAVTLLMGQGLFGAAAIVAAEPPLQSSAGALDNPGPQAVLALAENRAGAPALPGSNSISLGAEATQSGGGINVANPHLWWDSEMRWWQTQLTLPGQLDVSGAALIGLPLVVMGHTHSVAWSITTAEEAHRVALFELTLQDGEPTTYLVDGQPEPMERREIRVEVRRPDGSLDSVSKALWWTRYGPVAGPGSFLPIPPWTAGNGSEPGHAYVLADANAGNLRMLNTLFAFNHARSSQEILSAIRETQGVPWWTVTAADSAGQALWSQIQVLPNVTNEHAERCNTEFGQALFAGGGWPLLDGSRSECAWQSDADAIQPGILGPGTLDNPQLPYAWSERYLENSNGSHWLPASGVTLTGMPRIVGDEGTERSLRTRGVMTQLEDQLAREPFDRQRMQDLVLSNRSYSGDLAADDALAICRDLAATPIPSSSGPEVDVRAACEALARWDHHMSSDSAGAVLFHRFWSRVYQAALAGESPWLVPFDSNDPVHTPRSLDPNAPSVVQALADAVLELDMAGIPLDATLGDYQYVLRDGHRIPIGGAGDALGVINMADQAFGPHGFGGPTYGSGYLHVVSFDGDASFDDDACPDTVTLLTYSQSSEP